MMKCLKEYEFYRTDNGVLFCGDCVEVMKTIADDKIDFVLTDPPFNVGLEYESISDDMPDFKYSEWCLEWLNELYRILKPRHYAVIFTGDKKMFWLFKAITESKFTYHHLLKWYKPNSQRALSGTVMFNRIEVAFIISKEKPDIKLINKKVIYEDVIKYNVTSSRDKDAVDHNARRPVPMYRRIIEGFTNKDDLVLDCFIGTGTAAVASEASGRKWQGIELSKEVCETITKPRIENETNQLKFSFVGE